MKISGLFVASMAAASASASLISAISYSSTSPLTCNSNFQFSSEEEKGRENSTKKSTLTEKFAPRFDGLRFIETLITAHR
ncbi:CASP-like protein [Hibiscus syriacus]|uniref:CASP-like protein n=1 Tax=Hibiscus syriacus TaxID=106335 RepID=A0A6A3CSX1_HIBSY|nr:CASP-like protein [Hibiscus syriacus]